MKKIMSFFTGLDENKFVYVFGSLLIILAFIITSFCFFIDCSYIPLSIILSLPFVNLNHFLFIKQVDYSLNNSVKRYKFTLIYLLRYLVIIIPLALSVILYYFVPNLFNPIPVVISFIVYHYSYHMSGIVSNRRNANA
ncbi:MAG TPA: hypothetical protein DCY93_00445 [Firmicutes bacterium]|nr:hypothetical protein [Bacillota bacterium]